MKNYQKAEMIAKNLPTGSYAAGCPEMYRQTGWGCDQQHNCQKCEVAF